MEDEPQSEPQPGTSGTQLSVEEPQPRSTTSMLKEFPEEQRRHIRDVGFLVEC